MAYRPKYQREYGEDIVALPLPEPDGSPAGKVSQEQHHDSDRVLRPSFFLEGGASGHGD